MTTSLTPAATVSPLRLRLIADMTMRQFSAETQRNYLRDVGSLASFLGRSPNTVSFEYWLRFQIALQVQRCRGDKRRLKLHPASEASARDRQEEAAIPRRF